MGRIQTGVDRLVELVHQKQKISVEEAAKSLGVSRSIIQEWADFLEEEGLLELKYSLSKTYLISRSMNKGEVEQKEKQLNTQRETFIRKVDITIAQLENETVSLENFKKEFKSLQDNLGSDLKSVEKELSQLKEYDSLKTAVTKDIQKGRAELEEKQREAESHIQREYKRYHDLLKESAQQEKKIEAQRSRVHQLLQSEANATKKLSEYIKLIETMKKRVDDETEQLGLDERTLDKLHKAASDFHSDLQDIEKKDLKPLEEIRSAHEEKVKQLEQKVLAKAGMVKGSKGTAPKAVQKKVGDFFKRKRQIEELLRIIEKDKTDLEAELKELRQRADAYRLGKATLRFEELEAKLKIVDERKKGLQAHLKKFLHILK